MMSSDNFYDLSAILSTMTKRNVTVDKKKFDFRDVCQIRVTSEHPQCIEIKNTYEESEQWQMVSLQKRGRQVNIGEIQLKQLYTSPRSIPKPKVDDVLSLVNWIPPVWHDFYKNILIDRTVTSIDVEVIDGSETNE